MEGEKRLALLIDCDNASAGAIEGILSELAKFGVITIRRAYGNWKNQNLKGWEEKLHPHAIVPIQQFQYTSGKNATDAAMIIDAMDIMFSQRVDGFALVTSDSDFTPLVMRILSNGIKVYGFGEKKTPMPFVNACSQFIFTENLEDAEEEEEEEKGQAEPRQRRRRKLPEKELRRNNALVQLLTKAVELSANDDGWANLGKVGNYISNNSSFSPVNFGYSKLSDLLKAIGLFDFDETRGHSTPYLRLKKKAHRAVEHKD
ncbi:NYN domain-containing protein [bacterium]|nr:MAG: NYN domain-containing protein [bacterium]